MTSRYVPALMFINSKCPLASEEAPVTILESRVCKTILANSMACLSSFLMIPFSCMDCPKQPKLIHSNNAVKNVLMISVFNLICP